MPDKFAGEMRFSQKQKTQTFAGYVARYDSQTRADKFAKKMLRPCGSKSHLAMRVRAGLRGDRAGCLAECAGAPARAGGGGRVILSDLWSNLTNKLYYRINSGHKSFEALDVNKNGSTTKKNG